MEVRIGAHDGSIPFHYPSRRHERMAYKTQATVYLKGAVFAQTLEISEGGMLLGTPFRIPISSVLLIHFSLPDGQIRVQGRVIYTQHTKESASIHERTGIRFTAITENDSFLIRKFISSQRKKAA